MYVINGKCDIVNYPDDNYICYHGNNVNDVITNIEKVSNAMLKWFKHNAVQSSYKSKKVGHTTLEPLESLKPLGIFVDSRLNFNVHIYETCKKAGKKLSVQGRLENILSAEDKYVLFECLSLSHFNYCPVLWHCCNISDMKKI